MKHRFSFVFGKKRIDNDVIDRILGDIRSELVGQRALIRKMHSSLRRKKSTDLLSLLLAQNVGSAKNPIFH